MSDGGLSKTTSCTLRISQGSSKTKAVTRYLRLLKNYFYCPTHAELIVAYLEDQIGN